MDSVSATIRTKNAGVCFMLRFICSHCEDVFSIAEQYLGAVGKCSIYGERIALIGNPDATTPQMASVPTDSMVRDAQRSPTEKQREILEELGTLEAVLEEIDREEASDLIDALWSQKRQGQPATPRQIEYLKKLGAKPHQIEKLRSVGQASQLIEVLQPKPTRKQLRYLKKLGATENEIAALPTQGEAAGLIEELLIQRDGGYPV